MVEIGDMLVSCTFGRALTYDARFNEQMNTKCRPLLTLLQTQPLESLPRLFRIGSHKLCIGTC